MIEVKESVPGLKEANHIHSKLREIGIQDVQLFYDEQAKIWAVCQVHKHGGILLPDSYHEEGVKPYILWYCKDDTGHARIPNEQDLMDILTVVKRAPSIWDAGADARADKFDAQDAEKDRKHQEKFKQKIHEIAPRMKKAIKEGNL